MMRSSCCYLLLLICSVGAAPSQNCDFTQLFHSLKAGEITQAEHTEMYTRCILAASAGAKVSPPSISTAAPTSTDQLQTQYGFQPSCSADGQSRPLVQAIVKINNQGTFQAADNNTYPFHIRGVITLSEIDSLHTRVQATFTGLSTFLFDSNLFSIHVHQKGEINPTCTSTGGHYNPCGGEHSNDPSTAERHAGDIARLTLPADLSSQGDVFSNVNLVDPQVKLSGVLSVLGRSITVHAGSKSTRVGCGTIAVTEWDGVSHPDLAYDPTNAFWSS